MCKGYLDTGSQINVAHVKLLHKLKIKINKANTYTGFGNTIIVYPVGQASVTLCFENFSIDTIMHFVEVPIGSIDIIIG